MVSLPIPLGCEIPFPEEQIVQGLRVVDGKRLIIMMIVMIITNHNNDHHNHHDDDQNEIVVHFGG